jgi:hypothetical protein
MQNFIEVLKNSKAIIAVFSILIIISVATMTKLMNKCCLNKKRDQKYLPKDYSKRSVVKKCIK